MLLHHPLSLSLCIELLADLLKLAEGSIRCLRPGRLGKLRRRDRLRGPTLHSILKSRHQSPNPSVPWVIAQVFVDLSKLIYWFWASPKGARHPDLEEAPQQADPAQAADPAEPTAECSTSAAGPQTAPESTWVSSWAQPGHFWESPPWMSCLKNHPKNQTHCI